MAKARHVNKASLRAQLQERGVTLCWPWWGGDAFVKDQVGVALSAVA